MSLESITPLNIKDVHIDESFVGQFQSKVKNVMLPYQWKILNNEIEDVEKSNAIKNFKIAAGIIKGDFYGEVFQDTDLAKWIEGAAYSLQHNPDKAIEEKIDGIVDIIEHAQKEDGYLNTYFAINGIEKRWTNLYECHELYTAGHMIEAAVAYFLATGKDRFLQIMCKCADHIVKTFGEEENQNHGYPGHQEIEIALIRLYEVTKNEKYLLKSKYFLEKRGETPNFFIEEWKTSRKKCTFKTNTYTPIPNLYYNQSHTQIRNQNKAIGHSVRAMYMYTAMADIARLTNDEDLFKVCKTLWEDVVTKQMYITGAIGSTRTGEAFTFDYDLPLDTAYAETCASIGLAFFAHRMLKMEVSNVYSDIIEKIIYNIIPASVAEDGRSFLYVNPLEVWPEASENNPDRAHVKPVRQPWYGCACCPPNVVRFVNSFNEYIYSSSENIAYIHQYVAGTAKINNCQGFLEIIQKGNYPWDNKISIQATQYELCIQKIALRIPGWCKKYTIVKDGTAFYEKPQNGYVYIDCNIGTTNITIEFDMPASFVFANPKVRSTNGKVAIQKGPVIYCLEEVDNGRNLNLLRINTTKPILAEDNKSNDRHVSSVICSGYRAKCMSNQLYSFEKESEQETKIIAIPYFYWGNRSYGEMQVWSRY